MTSIDGRATTAVVTASLGHWTDEWDALVAVAPLPTPFLRSWWLTTVASRPTFVLLREGDVLIGGLALQQRFRIFGVPVYQFAGSGVLCPDHLDAVAAPGREAEVARALRAWLTRRGSRVLDLDGLVADSLLATALPGVRVETVDVAPWDLLPATVEEYLAGRSARQRKSLRQVQRRLALAGVTYRQVRPDDALGVLDAFARLQREQGGRERLLAEAPVPLPAFGYLLWQSFVGAGWIERDRMHGYAEKAMREASEGTSWRDADPAFEVAVHAAVDRAYDDPAVHRLLDELITEVSPYGWVNSLSQKLLQLCMPGVPDVYQGTELYDYSLVDPDNRRPVDFELRRRLLAELDAADADAGAGPRLDGTEAAKLWVTSRVLRERRAHPERFTGYTPLAVTGPAGQHAVAFDRGGVVAVATRLPVGLERSGGWRDTVLELPPGHHLDRLTGQQYRGEVELAELLGRYPVALLTIG